MKPRTFYLGLCFVGCGLPYWQYLPWVAQHGPNLPMFARELFANRISAFFGVDVPVSAVVLVVFMRVESRRLGIRGRWLPIAALLLVGVSLALPLFLYLRELGKIRDGIGTVRVGQFPAPLRQVRIDSVGQHALG